MKNTLKWIEISGKNLKHNILEARNHIEKQIQLSAVIKANAYGHGAEIIAPYLQKNCLTDSFSVVNVEEALELRNLGITKPITVLGYFTTDECQIIAEQNFIPFIYSISLLKDLNLAAKIAKKNVRVIVKVETGMGRLGEKGANLHRLLDQIKSCQNIEIAGFATHFAQSDSESSEKTKQQISNFNTFITAHKDIITSPSMICSANTGGIFLYPESHYDMVRLGIGLYGFYPSEYVKTFCKNTLRPILEYKTKIVHLQKIKKGESVSYSSTWKAKKDSTIGILPIGYADGYLRAFSNCASVLINGRKAPVRGRVCMDLTMVDLSEFNDIPPETEVTLISSNPDSECSVEKLAKFANTINYEITTMLPKHIPKRLVD